MTLPKRSLISLFFLFVVLFFPLSVSAQEYKSDEVVLKLRHVYPADERLKFHREIGGKLINTIDSLSVEVLQFTGIPIERMIERLKNDPRVEYAEPNFKAAAYELPNDPALLQNLQWGMFKINAAASFESAWNLSHGDPIISVAVLDTGIDSLHPDLSGKVVNSRNCTNSSTIEDLFGHGTHVAGIISADTGNGIGVAGVGYNISLINAKGLGDDGSGYYSWLADCLTWAADNGAKVINMSLGGSSDSKVLSDAVNYAWSKGAVLVAAAGNSGKNIASYPAYYANVLSVAATDTQDARASFSNFGKWVKVAAPGVNIYSTLPDTVNASKQIDYGYASGTSMSAPFVSGLAGLIFSTGITDNNKVVNFIEGSADKIAGTGSFWLYGRINAYQSLLAAKGITVVKPTPTATPTLTPTPTPTKTVSPKNPFSKLCSRFPAFCR